MITPRRTRLIRAADLHEFRHALQGVVSGFCGAAAVVVPTRAAGLQLSRRIRVEQPPDLVTRDQLYDLLHSRLQSPPPRLTALDREAIAQAAAEEAAREVGSLPFQIRAGLVSEMLRFYDQLRRQSQQVARFEKLITDALAGDSTGDRGAQRQLDQTRLLVATFGHYERRVADSGACDEHLLRERLLADSNGTGLKHVVVTVADWIGDPGGLFVADFDLLGRLRGLETIDLVATAAVLGSGFHERIHNWWPGLEEIDVADVPVGTALASGGVPVTRPTLALPSDDPDRTWFTYRDREEELLAIAERFVTRESDELNRTAVVFKHPLPYLYLAPDTLGALGVPYQIADALPLAAEPVISTVDLVLDAVETSFSRDSLIALLTSPHFDFAVRPDTAPDDEVELKPDRLRNEFRQLVSKLNYELSEKRYLGGLDRLESLSVSASGGSSTPATEGLQLALTIAKELAPLATARLASEHLHDLVAFLKRHLRVLDATDEFAGREQQARVVLFDILQRMSAARRRHHDSSWTIAELAAAIRRAIGDETFPVESTQRGVQLLDDQAARYGDFEDVTIVGLIEHEWPERPHRNIFYPPLLLKSLGWPSEKDRRAADEGRFLDLISSASKEIALSTFMLDDEAIVGRSMLLDEVPRARLSAVQRFSDRLQEARTSQPPLKAWRSAEALRAKAEGRASREATRKPSSWMNLRAERSPVDAPMFHGSIGKGIERVWSVSALETYTTCPFKFFAQHILKLDEEPDDEEVMDPRQEGRFVHKVFEIFFGEWQRAGHREITAANLETARTLFQDVVDRALIHEELPEGEAGLIRTKLLGSSAAAGLGEAVFRMEAERPVAVLKRLLEHDFEGPTEIQTNMGSRIVKVRGKVDRIDLLEDGTFRLIDYKLGWPPDRSRALQLPIYSVSAEQQLPAERGRQWKLGDAMYLAFKGPKRVVPLFSSTANRDEVLERAQQRLADTIDGIARGEFPPTPDDVYRCETCSFSSVCRKDYVGDV